MGSPVALRTLRIRSFKAIEDITIPFGPFTVLVGPNGCGKSTILQALDLLASSVQFTLKEYLSAREWRYEDLQHKHVNDTPIILTADFDIKTDEQVQRIRWEVTFGTGKRARIHSERVSVADNHALPLLLRDGRSMSRRNERTGDEETVRQTLPSSWLATIEDRDKRRFPTLVTLANWAHRLRGYFFLDPVALRVPARATYIDEIGFNGEALTPFLGHLRSQHPEGLERVIERVKQHYPRLVSIDPKRRRNGWTSLNIGERWDDRPMSFNARQVSDGLLRLIAVSAMHELPKPLSMLLLDEMENGLHPRLIGGFVAMLQRLAHDGPQIVVTTHSPITVNYCDDPESVLVVGRKRDGGVSVTPLSKSRGFNRLRAQFDLGELWYNVGEDRLVP